MAAIFSNNKQLTSCEGFIYLFMAAIFKAEWSEYKFLEDD